MKGSCTGILYGRCDTMGFLLGVTFLFPAAAGILISVLVKETKKRNRLYGAAVLLTDLLCLLVMQTEVSFSPVWFFKNTAMRFQMDHLGRLLLCIVMLMYTCVCFYAFRYMEEEERTEQFFTWYLISFGALIAVCISANLVTMYFCFEMLTLTTFPMVLHERTKEAVAAGMKYLYYSMAGALMGLLCVFFLYHFAEGNTDFVYGGFLTADMIAGHEQLFLGIMMTGIIGFGTKAGMFPMHSWLPTAHPVAPAPASALLSSIVAKAGVIAVIRLVYYSAGPALIQGTWMQHAWMILAMITIFMGSMMAFREKGFKKRLAFSSVSQISYILLSLSFLSEEGLRGGLLHFMSHAASKGCLFLVAGAVIHLYGYRNVSELKGIGKRMPVIFGCFTVASLSLVGIPPMGGFLSKWTIAGAALQSGDMPFAILAPVVLLVSALLTAGYLFPVFVDAFYPGLIHEQEARKQKETAAVPEPKLMTVPMICLCAAALSVGVWGNTILNFFGF